MTLLEGIAKLVDAAASWQRFQLATIAFVGVVSWALLEFADIAGVLDSLTAKIIALTPLVASMPSHPVMAKLNTVFPLSELAGFIAIWFGLYAFAMGIRFARSFLPTMGG